MEKLKFFSASPLNFSLSLDSFIPTHHTRSLSPEFKLIIRLVIEIRRQQQLITISNSMSSPLNELSEREEMFYF